jgi:PRC-barrel domain
VQRGEERSLLTAEQKGENPMKLARLEFTHHPRPPQRELRQRGVFDSGGSLIGHVGNIYVDNDENFRFVDVAMSGFMGIAKKHHLIPVEAIAEEDPGSITLRVDQQTVQSAPALDNPHAAPEEGLQRAAREHCGLAAVPPEP